MKTVFILLFSFSLICACNQSPHLLNSGSSEYSIVVTSSDTTMLYAANELRKYISKASGVDLPITGDTTLEKQIRIKTFDSPLPAIRWSLTENKTLNIEGSSQLYVLYAVYSFLEETMGIRYLSPSVDHIPSVKTLSLNQIEDKSFAPDRAV